MSICRWGFLSTAEIGQKNWLSIRNASNATLRGVASRSTEKAERFIATCQAHSPFDDPPRAFGSYDDLLACDEIDAVYIPLPTGIRTAWAIKAADAGKHILIEKPCAPSADDLQKILDACTANQVQFMDGVMLMHSLRMPLIRRVIDEKVGEIRRLTSNYCFRGPEEFFTGNIRAKAELEPQGCLGDVGWYCIRMMLWTMKWELPEKVTGRIIQATNDGVPLEFAGDLFFSNDATANFYCSFVTSLEQLFEIAGTAGSVRLDDFVLPVCGDTLEFSSAKPIFTADGCDFKMDHRRVTHSVEEPSHGQPGSQESRMIEKFSAAALSGDLDSQWCEISMKTQKVMDACLVSARSGNDEVVVS